MASPSGWPSELILEAASLRALPSGRRRRRRRPRRCEDGASPSASLDSSPKDSGLTAESSTLADGMKSGVSPSPARASLRSKVVPSLPSSGAGLSDWEPPPRRRRRRGRRDRCSDSSSGSTSEAGTIRSDSPAASAAGSPAVSTTLPIGAGRTSESSSGQTSSSLTDCPVAPLGSLSTASAACELCATTSSRGGRDSDTFTLGTEAIVAGGDCSSKIPVPKSSARLGRTGG